MKKNPSDWDYNKVMKIWDSISLRSSRRSGVKQSVKMRYPATVYDPFNNSRKKKSRTKKAGTKKKATKKDRQPEDNSV